MANLFDTRFKLPVHLLQLFLVIVVLILSIVRMFNRPPGAPRSRAGTMSLGMSAKSLVILLYEILSSHVRALNKWASLKAYVVLNALEIVFWGAVVFLMIQSNIKFCSGLSCTLSWVIVPLAISMSTLASYMTIFTWMDFRYFRKNGVQRGFKYSSSNAVEIESSDGDTTDGQPKMSRKNTQREPEILMTPQSISKNPGRSQMRTQRAMNSSQRYESCRPHQGEERRHHVRRHSHGNHRFSETIPNHFGEYRPNHYHRQPSYSGRQTRH